MNKFEQAALAVAMSGPGVGGRKGNNFRIGAVLTDGRRVVSARYNTYKTHPKLLKLTPWPFQCAECACIFNRGIDNCKGLVLYVARIRRDNSLAIAKPCSICESVIRLTQLKGVRFSNDNGVWQELELKSASERS